MPAPIAPDTTTILDTISGKMTALTLNNSSTLAYQTIKIGGVKDYTQLALPVGVLIPRPDDSQRHAMGGTIIEHTDVEVRSVVDYTDEAAAELQIIAIRDALMPLLNKYAVWPNCPTNYSSKVKPNTGHYNWMFLKPNWYRVHSVMLDIAQYYVVPGGIQ